ncbi:MAG: gamma-glutamyl-gamma-aminobutyrate hydrolase family protein [Coriobacteriia bacterium]|nr:gamma-glutamyl-gamma-aminobutyrate hydrolase family protein [Coriobacteriia bacterium]
MQQAENGQHVPLVGIVPSYVPEEDIFRLKQNYCQAIEQWGGMPLILPMTDDVRIYEYLLPQIDGFLFTGGHDISPECYGETYHSEKLSPLTPGRDRMEDRILNYAYDCDIPVLGVCRGMQMINVHFGGTLYQDLSEQYSSIGGNQWALEGVYIPDGSAGAVESAPLSVEDVQRILCPGCVYDGHDHPSCTQDRLDMARTTAEYGIMQSSEAAHLKHWQQDHYECPSHFVSIDRESVLGDILQTDHLAVNSMHHQGVKTVSPRLRACAWATDGLVEAVEMPDRLFFVGVQWHPEFFRIRMGLLFKRFIAASLQRYEERLAAGTACVVAAPNKVPVREGARAWNDPALREPR